jgi:hypothetical protein
MISLWAIIAAILLVLFLSYYLKVHDHMLIFVIALASARWIIGVHHSDDSVIKWVLLETVTMFVFWRVIKLHRLHWRNPVLWLSMTVLLFAHLAGFWLLLRKFEQMKPGLIIAAGMPEMITICVALEWALTHFGKRKHVGRVRSPKATA